MVSSAFIQFLDAGVWYIFLYNDASYSQQMTFVATIQGQLSLVFRCLIALEVSRRCATAI